MVRCKTPALIHPKHPLPMFLKPVRAEYWPSTTPFGQRTGQPPTLKPSSCFKRTSTSAQTDSSSDQLTDQEVRETLIRKLGHSDSCKGTPCPSEMFNKYARKYKFVKISGGGRCTIIFRSTKHPSSKRSTYLVMIDDRSTLQNDPFRPGEHGWVYSVSRSIKALPQGASFSLFLWRAEAKVAFYMGTYTMQDPKATLSVEGWGRLSPETKNLFTSGVDGLQQDAVAKYDSGELRVPLYILRNTGFDMSVQRRCLGDDTYALVKPPPTSQIQPDESPRFDTTFRVVEGRTKTTMKRDGILSIRHIPTGYTALKTYELGPGQVGGISRTSHTIPSSRSTWLTFVCSPSLL